MYWISVGSIVIWWPPSDSEYVDYVKPQMYETLGTSEFGLENCIDFSLSRL